jgi:hypothetical protein
MLCERKLVIFRRNSIPNVLSNPPVIGADAVPGGEGLISK